MSKHKTSKVIINMALVDSIQADAIYACLLRPFGLSFNSVFTEHEYSDYHSNNFYVPTNSITLGALQELGADFTVVVGSDYIIIDEL